MATRHLSQSEDQGRVEEGVRWSGHDSEHAPPGDGSSAPRSVVVVQGGGRPDGPARQSELAAQRAQSSRITKYGPLAPDEARAFREMAGPELTFLRGHYVRHRGDPDPKVYFLRSGWMACSITFDDGARQIVKIHLPGDLVGVPSFASPVAGETIQALSDAVVAPVSNRSFGDLFRNHPRLAAILFVACQEERALLMQRLAWVGRTRSIQRVAELILSLHDRVLLADPEHVGPIFAPLSQEEIGDATGLTVVTVNRCLRDLRRLRIASWRRFSLEVQSRQRLGELVGLPREAIRDLSWFEDQAWNRR